MSTVTSSTELTADSYRYLESLGFRNPRNKPEVQEAMAEAYVRELRAAIATGAPIDAQKIQFLADYASKHDDMRREIGELLYGSGQGMQKIMQLNAGVVPDAWLSLLTNSAFETTTDQHKVHGALLLAAFEVKPKAKLLQALTPFITIDHVAYNATWDSVNSKYVVTTRAATLSSILQAKCDSLFLGLVNSGKSIDDNMVEAYAAAFGTSIVAGTADQRSLVTALKTVLQDQVDDHHDLDAVYVKLLAIFDKAQALKYLVDSLNDGIPCPNRLVDDSGSLSDDGITNDTTPRIEINLNAMGGMLEDGDVVYLYDEAGHLVGKSSPLTHADIALGKVQLQITSPLTEGQHKITSQVYRNAGGVWTAVSDHSVALSVKVDTTAPVLGGAGSPANITYHGTTYPAIVPPLSALGVKIYPGAQNQLFTFDFNQDIAWSGPAGLLYQDLASCFKLVRKDGTGAELEGVVAYFYGDGRVSLLTFPGAVPNLSDYMLLYEPDVAHGLYLSDVAGNVVTRFAVTNLTSYRDPGVYAPSYSPGGPVPATTFHPPVRTLDADVWRVLDSLDSDLATEWWNHYSYAGKLPDDLTIAQARADEEQEIELPYLMPDWAWDLPLTEVPLNWLVYMFIVTLARIQLISEQIGAQTKLTEAKTGRLKQYTEIMAELNNLKTILGPDAKYGEKINSKAGGQAQVDKLNAMIKLYGFNPFAGTGAGGANTTDDLYVLGTDDLQSVEKAITNQQAQIDKSNTDGQQDMLKMNSLTDKYNENITRLSALLDKADKILEEMFRRI